MATYNEQMLTVVQQVEDLVAKYSYRAADFGFIAGNSKGKVHIIFGVADPTGLLAGVSDGSLFVDIVAHKIYIKANATATAGIGQGFAGSWTAV